MTDEQVAIRDQALEDAARIADRAAEFYRRAASKEAGLTSKNQEISDSMRIAFESAANGIRELQSTHSTDVVKYIAASI